MFSRVFHSDYKIDVSIIVGGYNQEAYIDAAVYSAVNQIVPLRCSGHLPTFEVIKSVDVKGIGASAHRNNAIRMAAKGDWILWLDGDDLLPSHYLYHMWQNNKGDSPNLFVAAPVQFFSGCRLDKFDYITFPPSSDPAHRCLRSPFGMSALFSRDQWEAVDGFDEHCINMNDVDFWLRLQFAGYDFVIEDCTFMLKRDVPASLMKKHSPEKNAEILSYFNEKHKLNLKSKVLPYMIPQTTIL